MTTNISHQTINFCLFSLIHFILNSTPKYVYIWCWIATTALRSFAICSNVNKLPQSIFYANKISFFFQFDSNTKSNYILSIHCGLWAQCPTNICFIFLFSLLGDFAMNNNNTIIIAANLMYQRKTVNLANNLNKARVDSMIDFVVPFSNCLFASFPGWTKPNWR